MQRNKDFLVTQIKSKDCCPDLWRLDMSCLPATSVTCLLGPFLTRLLLLTTCSFLGVFQTLLPQGFCPHGSLCLEYSFQRHPRGLIPYFSLLSIFIFSERTSDYLYDLSSPPRPLHPRWPFFPALSVSWTCYSQRNFNRVQGFLATCVQDRSPPPHTMGRN